MLQDVPNFIYTHLNLTAYMLCCAAPLPRRRLVFLGLTELLRHVCWISNTWPCLTRFGVSVARSSEVHIRTSLDYSLFLLERWATYLSHMCVRHRAQMKHTLGRRSAASAVAFLKADSQAGGGGWGGTVTAGVVFWELFDGHLVALLLFLL